MRPDHAARAGWNYIRLVAMPATCEPGEVSPQVPQSQARHFYCTKKTSTSISCPRIGLGPTCSPGPPLGGILSSAATLRSPPQLLLGCLMSAERVPLYRHWNQSRVLCGTGSPPKFRRSGLSEDTPQGCWGYMCWPPVQRIPPQGILRCDAIRVTQGTHLHSLRRPMTLETRHSGSTSWCTFSSIPPLAG